MTKLREVMDSKNVTLADIAAKTGLDKKTIWHATQGKKTRRSTKIAIAGFFGLPDSALFLDSHILESISSEVVLT